jgi:hypothetical protein
MRILPILLACAAVASAQGLRVGAAEVVISPPVGTPMAGYYNTRLSTGVHDDLHAKAIVIASGDVKVALVACDLVGIPPTVIEEARKIIQNSTGIPPEHVMISATHSHTGPLIPDGGARAGAYGGDLPIAKQYRAELPGKIANAVAQAAAKLAPARISFGKGQETSVSFNRRFFMRDGTVGWNPGKLNPNILRPAGPIDPEMPVVYFESEKGEPIATYVNFSLHQDTVGGLEASSDFAYTLAQVVGKVKGGLTVFTQSTSGNINHIDVKSKDPQKGHDEAARIGTILAGEVVKTYARLAPVTGAGIETASGMVPLQPAQLAAGDVEKAQAIAKDLDGGKTVPFLDTVFAFKALDTAARKGEPLPAEVQVIALNDQVAWVAVPGEVFTELGQAIKHSSPFPLTIVVELAHGPVTYFPNDPAFNQGNYEVVTSRAARGSGEKLAEAAKGMLRDAYGPRQKAIRPKETVQLFNGKNLDGWYTYLHDNHFNDPKGVFTVKDGAIRISGEEWGGLGTRQEYRDYHLIVEWKWGGPAHGNRADRARDSGILVHGVGEDGLAGGQWLESIESQIIEGGAGDLLMVAGKRMPWMTAKIRTNGNAMIWDEQNGVPTTRDRGRFDWYGRDPQWKDVLGFRGREDVEKPTGEWNTQEVICDGGTVKNILNGKLVNSAYDSDHTFGKIMLQSEGAEIWIRRVEIRPLDGK